MTRWRERIGAKLGGWRTSRVAQLGLSRPLRVGVVGAGRAARFHLDALAGIGGAEIAFIANRGAARAGELASAFGVTRVHGNLAQAIGGKRVDAAIIAVNPESTAGVATTLIEAGIPCLVEKPVGLDASEGQRLADLARARGVTCAAAFNRRTLASVRRARAMAEALAPYAIHIEAPERIEKQHAAGKPSAILDRWLSVNSVHAIDLFTLFAGPAEKIIGIVPEMPFKARAGREDYTSLIRFESGAVGSFVSHWHSPGEWKMDLFFPGARATVDLRRNELRIEGDAPEADGDVCPADDGYDTAYKPGVYLQDYLFFEAVARNGALPAPLADLAQATRSMQLAEAIAAS